MNPQIQFSDWVRQCTPAVKPKTAESYRSLLRHLERHLGHQPLLADIASTEACLRFSRWLLRQVQPSSAKTYLTKLYALLRKAHAQGLTPFNPAAHEELRLPRLPPKEPSYLTPAQVMALERAPCPHEATKRAFLFAVHTGLRLSDIETLRWSHIKSHRGHLMVVKEQVKTARLVRVPLNDKALALLGKDDNKEGLVFDLKSRATISTDLRIWAKNAGLDLRLTFHMSRHTFVTILLQSDLSIYTASRLCGHTQVATTERYAHLTDPLYDEALRHLNRYWSTVQRE